MTAEKTSPGERTRTTTWQDPAMIVKAIPEMSGLDFIRAMRDGPIPSPPILSLIGLRFTEIEKGATLPAGMARPHWN